jgi:hypothetical protein
MSYNEYLIKDGELYNCDRHGNKGHRVASNVDRADYSESMGVFLVLTRDGVVVTRDRNGNIRNTIARDARNARFNGDEFLVEFNNGRTMRVDKHGNKREM